MSGTYALKLATRPYPGHTATGIRRLTMSGRGLLQIEAYLAYKAEAVVDPHADNAFGDMEWDGNRHPSEAQFGAFTVATDLCGDDGVRYHTVVRYQNADEDGNMLRQWKYPVVPEPTPREAYEGKVDYPYATDFTAPDPDDWRVYGQPQELCMNEVPTKVNRSEEHTSELQSRGHLVCRLLLEKKKRQQGGKGSIPPKTRHT